VRACEVLFAPRTIAAKKIGIRRWALALALPRRAFARRVLCGGERRLGLGCPSAFGAARSVPPALSLAFFPTVGGSPILLAGTSSPPASSLGAALRATVSGLGMCVAEGLLTSLEETPSLPRPTCPLTGSSLAASLMWAQGSCELPTAKPRTRSSLPPLRGAFLDHAPLIGRPLPSKLTTIRPRFQATRVGTRRLKPTNYSLVRCSLKRWYPRGLLPTNLKPETGLDPAKPTRPREA
jgi:hypothetical protein